MSPVIVPRARSSQTSAILPRGRHGTTLSANEKNVGDISSGRSREGALMRNDRTRAFPQTRASNRIELMDSRHTHTHVHTFARRSLHFARKVTSVFLISYVCKSTVSICTAATLRQKCENTLKITELRTGSRRIPFGRRN